MIESKMLPDELRSLLNNGTLRESRADAFVIDALRHRERMGSGWNTVIYSLEIDEGEDGHALYEIREETEDYGGDILLSTSEADEAATWITGMIEEMEE